MNARRGDPQNFIKTAIASDTDECVLWPYSISSVGYGQCYNPKTKRPGNAHRMVCEAVHGEADADQYALHSCDVKACINPRHLRWGTQQENIHDAKNRARLQRGEANGQAKLTFMDVRAIRASHEPVTVLANRYGIDPSNVSKIRKHRTWVGA